MSRAVDPALPAACMVCAASDEGWLVGWVRAGVEGYRPSVLPFAFAGEAAAYVRFINQSLGVDQKAQACMLAGAMVGWQDQRADPRQTEDFGTYFLRKPSD